MSNAALILFLVAALLCHTCTGDAEIFCTRSDITFSVCKTGRVVGRQPEYTVSFETSCFCPMKDVLVWCDGLQDSAVLLDAGKVEVHDRMCLLKQAVAKGSPLVFTYSSEVPVNFRVFSAAAHC